MVSSSNSRRSPIELIQRARDGESNATGRLLSLYVNYLNILATTQLDRKLRNRVSPSDVVQDTLYEAHRDFQHFRGQSEREFSAWLRQIMIHNLARTVERNVLTEKRDIRRELSLQDLKRSVDQSAIRMGELLTVGQVTPSSEAIARERSVLLADCMAELPDDYRQVVLLRNFHGLPFSEVATQMERSSGAVRMLWLRALKHLKDTLEARGVQ